MDYLSDNEDNGRNDEGGNGHSKNAGSGAESADDEDGAGELSNPRQFQETGSVDGEDGDNGSDHEGADRYGDRSGKVKAINDTGGASGAASLREDDGV